MAVDFSNTLIVAISATALFDLSESENYLLKLLQQRPTEAIKEFRDYMAERENDPLSIGAGYPLIKALLNLNKQSNQSTALDPDIETPLVEVVIVSKSSPDTGIQVLNAIREHKLNISRSAFISGSSVAPYIDDFNIDLFLTTNRDDAQQVADADICACAILDATPVNTYELDTEQLCIAFDGDAVLFDDSGELLYKQKGLRAFHEREAQMRDMPIKKGPYAELLIKLSNLQARLPAGLHHCPIKIALVTARNAPADLRAIKTLREWGVNVDMAFFLGGLEKTAVLKTFAPHIFFDDSIKHIDAARSFVPTALVPYHSASLLHADSSLATDKDASSLFFTPAQQTIFTVNH
ncbi:5'-nucleotidase [Psychrobacter sp. LV10R520-6]|uniref:5'-nucleotidase n=1 Tax=Psychrobacter sp. LV10R520-6 TaxID=1415574 RepID=UPI0024CD04E4|nr:5'-nucleotidase [Psychrobacter sp. LV10R520-6]SNT70816.1 5'-nucleotidase [Psychrobacter sp. LV10R520-6]